MKYLLISDLLTRGLLTSFVALFVLISIGCSSNSESTNTNPVSPSENELISLSAEVVQWDVRIGISYTVTNNSDVNIIAFDGRNGGFDGLSGRFDDHLQKKISESKVRLFKGQAKINLDAAKFLTEPLIGGRLLMPDGSLTGIGNRDYPIEIQDLNGGPMDKLPITFEEFEFCISYEIAADDVVGDNDYPLYIDLDAPQSLACVMLARPE